MAKMHDIGNLTLQKCSKFTYSSKEIKKDNQTFISKNQKPKINLLLKKSNSKGSRMEIGIDNRRMDNSIRRKVLQKVPPIKSSSKNLLFSSQQHKSMPVSNSVGNGGKFDWKKKRRKKDKITLTEPSCLQRKARYQLVKMKLEQNLIDAYSADGWKGQSRVKIKPEKELMRAKKQILKCKHGLRDTIQQLDLLSSVGCIEGSVIAPDGSVSHEHIFCANCKSNEVSLDNDIILCDGTCNCAFHQKCLDPPLDTENIPSGDQGWYCKFCECRMEILEAMNAHLGTHFSLNCNWQDIFKEVGYDDGESMLFNPPEEWPSDDSEDDDYDPSAKEKSNSGSCTDDGASSASISDGLQHSFDSESSDGNMLHGHRQRRKIDYKKLYDEMFGKDVSAEISEDEDWGPGKRKQSERESHAARTLMTLGKLEQKETTTSTKMACNNKHANANIEIKGLYSQVPQMRRQILRFPPFATERLRQVFSENELPSRLVKGDLSRELGLEIAKVSKWFKNARYMALKSRKSLQLRTGNDESGAMKPRGAFVASSANREKVMVEFHDDMSLKNLLKAIVKKRKNRIESASKASNVAEDEIERFCHLKLRVLEMKQKLLKLHVGVDDDWKLKPTSLPSESIVYVPVAEIREKH